MAPFRFYKFCLVFAPLLIWSESALALNKPKVSVNQISDSFVSFVVSSSKLRSSARNIRTKLVFEAQCEGSRYIAIGARVNPRPMELFYDSPPSDVVCRYRARVAYRNTKRTLRRMISKTVSVVISDPDAPTDSPSPSPTPVRDLSGPSLPAQFSECSNGVESEMIARVNFHRQQAGGNLLSYSALLRKAARTHAIMMGRQGMLSHEGWLQEIMDLGYTGSFAAQNIATSINDPLVVVDLWMTSEMHRMNLLSNNAATLGAACVRDQAGIEWWAMDLGN